MSRQARTTPVFFVFAVCFARLPIAPRVFPLCLSAGLSAAQVLPALAGAIVGIPGGIALFAAVGDSTTLPPLWQLLSVIPLTVLAIAGLTAIPARVGARRPVATILQSELA
jgi:putative ABC transport system permease protein